MWIPPFVTKVRCSFEVRKMIWPMIRNTLIVCCNYMEGIYSPACRSRKRTHNKDKICCCGCDGYSFICLFIDLIRWWHRPTDCEVF